MGTTDYFDTLITPAPDCPVASAEQPPQRASGPTVAELQFDMIASAPYRWTSDDVVFTVWADRAGIAEAERPAAREAFFAKGQPCLRSSPLGKRYGWGIHSDAEGRVALVASGGEDFRRLEADDAVTKVAAMRSRR
jgi:hypothetical protein